MDVNVTDIPDEFITNISSIIVKNEVKIFKKEADIYEIVNVLLEKNQSEDPFFVINLGDIVRQYQKWTTHLPNIKPFYAVKCNPDPVILRLLANLNVCFDCASKNEIAKVIGVGVKPEDIIFANPCKMSSQIKFSRSHDVDLLTFDSENELYKIKLYHPEANLLIRIKTNDCNSLCKFSNKFGANLEEIKDILNVAKGLKINVIGVSFHVGSNCQSVDTYAESIKDAKDVFNIAKELGFNFQILNIGGGFPGTDTEKITFKDIATTVNDAIANYFNDIEDLKIMAEPGRFFVASSHTLVLNVINKKIRIDKETGEKIIIYYCNDGLYSSLNGIVMDHFVVDESNLIPFNERHEKKYKCQLFGQTCDSADQITESIMLPDLAIGETLLINFCGAYSRVWFPNDNSIDLFNGFSMTESKYVLN
ncbi:ornithine decarboxylase [Klosneuvirus KNV1]|uniref:Ornithine decarboxylase n=1 Tax=Klosneuvirus KNV1 TaxID=1977640 RepID=A0A1V0SKK0_9VIRU|nr:ornithine decarboxylase [Klosneuvirus KNV1]